MKKYCPSCGKQNPASAKFCCHCGDNMSLSTANVKSKRNPLKASRPQEIDDDYDDDDGDSEDIQITATKLDVDIMPQQMGNQTIGSLMHEGETSGPVSDGYVKKGGPIQINEQQFLEEFRREAGPIRGDQSVGEK